MANESQTSMSPEHRARTGKILQSIGIFDVFLGAVAFLGGPSFYDFGPGREWTWPLIGLIVAVGGVAVWWAGKKFGRQKE